MAQLHIDASLQALIESIMPSANRGNYRIRRLSGLSSENWRITFGQTNWLAREQTAEQRLLGIERQQECKVLKHLAQSHIAPKVIAANSRWLVLEWIHGNSVTTEQFQQLANTDTFAALIAKLHHLSPTGYRLNLHQQLRRYGNLIDPARYSSCWLKLHHAFLRRPLPQVLKLAPLHMDIHSGNVLVTPLGLRLIDWEYASDGDIALDLAALFYSNAWDREQQQIFLHYYCCQPGGYRDIKRLSQQIQRWLPWVGYLMLMWSEARWQQTRNPLFLDMARPLRQKFNLYTRHTSSCRWVGYAQSPESLIYVSSSGFFRLPPSCISNYFGYG